MFTGLVQAVGTIAAFSPAAPAGRRLLVDASNWAHRSSTGDSINVSGCCLTVAAGSDLGRNLLAFDVVLETLSKTTLGDLSPGGRVNLEHSVTPTTLMGGHVVQGHVEGIASVDSVQSSGEWRVRVRPAAELMPFLTPKGSVCLDGVSLTIAAVDPAAGWFEVALIPTTLAVTTLGAAKPGSRLNIETDILARTMVHYLRHYGR